MAARICVYTCLIGNSEKLNEQPYATSSGMPFICFTDDPDLRSKTWDVRVVPRLFGMDPVRSQRAVKILPYEFLPDFAASLYIDNSVLLAQAPEALIERSFPASGFCLLEHSYRATVLDEFLEVAALGLNNKGRVFEQLKHYTEECPAVLQEKPYWGAILLRDHGHATVRKMLEIWFAHVQRYSRRDQLSVNLAFRLAGLAPNEALRQLQVRIPFLAAQDRHQSVNGFAPDIGRCDCDPRPRPCTRNCASGREAESRSLADLLGAARTSARRASSTTRHDSCKMGPHCMPRRNSVKPLPMSGAATRRCSRRLPGASRLHCVGLAELSGTSRGARTIKDVSAG